MSQSEKTDIDMGVQLTQACMQDDETGGGEVGEDVSCFEASWMRDVLVPLLDPRPQEKQRNRGEVRCFVPHSSRV